MLRAKRNVRTRICVDLDQRLCNNKHQNPTSPATEVYRPCIRIHRRCTHPFAHIETEIYILAHTHCCREATCAVHGVVVVSKVPHMRAGRGGADTVQMNLKAGTNDDVHSGPGGVWIDRPELRRSVYFVVVVSRAGADGNNPCSSNSF